MSRKDLKTWITSYEEAKPLELLSVYMILFLILYMLHDNVFCAIIDDPNYYEWVQIWIADVYPKLYSYFVRALYMLLVFSPVLTS